MRVLCLLSPLLLSACLFPVQVDIHVDADEPEALIGPGEPAGGNITCGTTATEIAYSRQLSYDCMVDDAAGADVFVGPSDVTTSTGQAFGAGEHFGGNVKREYCIVASGTITIHCRALTGQ